MHGSAEEGRLHRLRENNETDAYKRPLFSVILIAFDRQNYISGAFRSIVSQTLDSSLYEIIVIKNFPNAMIDGWTGAPSVRVVQSPSPSIGESYSEGVRISGGRIICFLDDDDEFEPDRLERIQELFSTRKGPVYYHNQRTVVDEDGRAIRNRWASSLAGNQGVDIIEVGPSEVAESSLPATFEAYFNESSMALSREVLEGHLGELESAPTLIDIFMVCTAVAEKATFVLDSRRTTRYRVHGNQVSGWSSGKFSDPSINEENSVIRKHIDVERSCMQLVRGTFTEQIFMRSLPRLVLTNQLYFSSRKETGRMLRNMYAYLRRRNASDVPDMLLLAFLSFTYSISRLLPRKVAGMLRR